MIISSLTLEEEHFSCQIRDMYVLDICEKFSPQEQSKEKSLNVQCFILECCIFIRLHGQPPQSAISQ